jgi:hypothetical protein
MSFKMRESVPKLLLALECKMSGSKALATQVARVVRIIGRKAFL